jgi:hypothetical protein
VRLLLITAACAAAFALPVLADQPTPPTGGGPAAATAPAASTTTSPVSKTDEGIICKMKQVTGSRFGVKVCTTKAQREVEAQNARDMLAARAMADKPPGS